MLPSSDVQCKMQGKFFFLKKKKKKNLKRISLLNVELESGMRASFALNMYEITHEVSLVSAF